ncbi:hypothetical protein [Lapidilactobacillus luobeiensis]|uniref:hypothetical protein n=1 Tax=Lapidilactobacillus luobeiensis TaxID=2950371 RepID=UPI0021C2F948|nr:hypothetical protein [Lapidilactobacillus luobeiensis]
MKYFRIMLSFLAIFLLTACRVKNVNHQSASSMRSSEVKSSSNIRSINPLARPTAQIGAETFVDFSSSKKSSNPLACSLVVEDIKIGTEISASDLQASNITLETTNLSHLIAINVSINNLNIKPALVPQKREWWSVYLYTQKKSSKEDDDIKLLFSPEKTKIPVDQKSEFTIIVEIDEPVDPNQAVDVWFSPDFTDIPVSYSRPAR